MKQYEYLRELEENLKYQIPLEELKDILSDYESFFISGREEGKCDDEISEELGSPAFLSKLLLEEHGKSKATQQEAVKHIANPGKRLCAYIIDAVIALLPVAVTSFAIGATMFIYFLVITFPSPVIGVSVYSSLASFPLKHEEQYLAYSYRINNSSTNEIRKDTTYRDAMNRNPKIKRYILLTITILGLLFYIFYSFICTIIFKGQTLGKKLMHIRIQCSNTELPTKGTIFYREFLGKVLLNSIPIMPVVSILTILLTKEHKALHDMLADTIVTKA